MSLYVRLNCNFFTHRKTARLRARLGDDALWLVPRLWTYAAENQPNGVFADYSAEELASVLGYAGDAPSMLQALLQAGFMEEGPPLKIHDWAEHNGFHVAYAERARKAANARWQKERTKEKEKDSDKRGEEPSNASGMLEASGSTKPGVKGKAEGPPKFEPVPKGLYRREYEALLKDAHGELESIKNNPANYAKDLCTSAEESIAWLQANKPEGWESKASAIASNPANYERGPLKPIAAASVAAWKQRIAEIKSTMAGIIN